MYQLQWLQTSPNQQGARHLPTSEAERRTAKGKFMVATFKQCARYLYPLSKFCREKESSAVRLLTCYANLD
ncbi:hypothetical protein ACFX13_018248 [Malus domestica]